LGPAGGIGAAIKAYRAQYGRPKYVPTVWEHNAASTTTGVYSGFAIDRSIDLRTINALNQVRLGRVAALDQQQRDDYFAQAVGRVKPVADDVPLVFLDPRAPNPSAVLGA
jgi:hypothetical protein